MTAMPSYADSFIGGGLIGLSSAILVLLNGRIAGISGIVSSLFRRLDAQLVTNAAFVLGLMAGPFVFHIIFAAWPAVEITAALPMMVAAGLLVGFGTRLGSGCTSGHGVSGLARLSPRSLAAVATFLSAAILTVFVMRHTGLK